MVEQVTAEACWVVRPVGQLEWGLVDWLLVAQQEQAEADGE